MPRYGCAFDAQTARADPVVGTAFRRKNMWSPLDARTLKLAAPQVAAALVPNPYHQSDGISNLTVNRQSPTGQIVSENHSELLIRTGRNGASRILSCFHFANGSQQSVSQFSQFSHDNLVRSNTNLLHVGGFSSVSPASVAPVVPNNNLLQLSLAT